MLRKTMLLNLFLLAAMLITACTPAAKTPEAMMAATPTGAMMDQPAQTTDAMMQPTSTMMGEGTPTVDAMMQPTDAMMDHGSTTPTVEAMMDQGTVSPTGDIMMQPTGTMASTPGASMGQNIPSTGMSDAMMAAWTAKELTNPASGQTFKINDYKGKVVLVQTFTQMCATCLAQQQEIAKLDKMMGMNSDLMTVSLDIDPNEDATMLKAYLKQRGFDWNFAVAPAEVSQEISTLYSSHFVNPASAPLLVIDRKGEAHLLPSGIQSAEELQKALEPYIKAGM